MRAVRLLLLLLVGGMLGCAGGPNREALRRERPALDPLDYFSGRSVSWGVFEDRQGAPTKIIRTEIHGRRDGETLRFAQTLRIGDDKVTRRSWTIRRVSAYRYEATGTDIVGIANAEVFGNAMHLKFTMDAVPGNPLGRVRMSQWLYLQADGTLLNRARASKAGVTLAEITEHFRKVR